MHQKQNILFSGSPTHLLAADLVIHVKLWGVRYLPHELKACPVVLVLSAGTGERRGRTPPICAPRPEVTPGGCCPAWPEDRPPRLPLEPPAACGPDLSPATGSSVDVGLRLQSPQREGPLSPRVREQGPQLCTIQSEEGLWGQALRITAFVSPSGPDWASFLQTWRERPSGRNSSPVHSVSVRP